MTEAEVLNKAADLIDEHGWCQRHYATEDGRMCAEGAIFYASEVDPMGFNFPDVVSRPKVAFEIWLGRSVVSWNDDFERTQDEVTAALRAAAKAVTS